MLLYYQVDSVAPFLGFQSHNGIEMYYIEKGTGNYLVGDKTYPLQPGTLMIIRPHTLHKVLQTDINEIICRNVLMWKEEFLESGWERSAEFPLRRMSGECSHIRFAPGLHKRIQHIYASIHEELARRKTGYESILQCLIKELLLLAYRAYSDTDPNKPSPIADNIPKEISYLVQYISSNFHHSDMSLKKLSQLVHMNSSYLSNIFHKYTGTTLVKFVAVKRMHHAKKLLRETKLPVTDIAFQCGFNNHSYFIKMFKKAENLSPLAYRRQHQQEKSGFP